MEERLGEKKKKKRERKNAFAFLLKVILLSYTQAEIRRR
jgi:hypothetical protein